MDDENIYYCRNLPHYQPSHAAYFITFRLVGSLPNEIIINLKEEYEIEEKHLETIKDEEAKKKGLEDHRKRYFMSFNDFLDKHSDGPKWLRDNSVAKIVTDALHYRNGKEYELIAYCVMPNHVHLVVNVERSVTSLYKVLQSLKAYTARECNKILNRSGAFWQHESYDHVVRDGKELERIISYVLNNPVSAGFINDWKKWKWSYCKYEI